MEDWSLLEMLSSGKFCLQIMSKCIITCKEIKSKKKKNFAKFFDTLFVNRIFLKTTFLQGTNPPPIAIHSQ